MDEEKENSSLNIIDEVTLRPVIGIFATRTRKSDIRFGEKVITYVNAGYIDAVSMNGGIPLIIPYSPRACDGISLLKHCDGVIFPGGTDVNPILFDEQPSEKLGPVDPEVDDFLYDVMKECIRRKMPMLTICKGMQLLNIALGGTLYQDLSCRKEESISHLQFIDRSFPFHEVNLVKDSLMYSIFQKDSIYTNSLHHQAIKKIAPELRITGTTSDGLVEAIEGKEIPVIGVQWHPEDMVANPRNYFMNKLFKYFIKEMAGKTRRR
ncbi:MAG: gamma-glutamyl-gamma-aminobutyrate hydrolase family protein [Tissierellia bacterium]|nr:gamma-glutamyl-gamma-aminobutyrate hydrolase family protein [Tissierellia bacterium]